MNHSIKSRFILIYVVLVLISMFIASSFIIDRLERVQVETATTSMIKTMDTLATTTSAFFKNNNYDTLPQLDETLKDWGISSEESAYIISAEKNPKIIASTKNISYKDLKSAYEFKYIEPKLVMDTINGKSREKIVEYKNEKNVEKHITRPILSGDGKILAIIYVTRNLNSIYSVIDDSKVIITYATLISLIVTSILGYFIANSITDPIRALTKKTRAMAKGNFNQSVEIKSDDEIGELGKTFNFLTKELRETIEKMDLEKSKLDTIFNYMAEGVIAIDRKNRLIHANSIAKKILNISEKDFNREINLKSINLYNVDYKNEESLKGEELTKIGDNFYKIKYAPYKSDAFVNSGLIIVLQDINKEHLLDIMRKEFVANVSHELKTPITTIKSYTETLLESELDDESEKKFLRVIDRENSRMSRIVTDLLSLSNIDYNRNNLSFSKFDTYEFIDEAIESQSILISSKNHKIEFNIAMDINDIYADRNGADQILTNIISNACKYTPENGKISILAKNVDDFVEIKISDNGIGIPEEDLPRITERFYRVEKGRSRAMGGTGLGLSIANEMIKLLGGNLKLDSKFGEGTTVTLLFRTGDENGKK
ncbi:MAG: ATP-binding protein [Peptoniphilus rhinitidis]|uniref:HAMP domain-containing sensor histidine kinase n=1 Tax=Peptoniphilus rhinitidis TaxID=1175452 RepID=UPI0029035358|nr:ATP-binding protein [Peptoniphilus rhinitidis]MDU2109420.1 ATP-binding protein [Peptoniphilus lacydonensis]MDU3750361.1 ATP-binding protein [Peptoniphilus rhinitidis]